MRTYEHHYFAGKYFSEYKGFKRLHHLFDHRWGREGFHLEPDAQADDLYRYLSYIIGEGFARHDRVMLQFNRLTFRLGWFRRNFPRAKVVHIHRDPDAQWNSVVKRAQSFHGRHDVGQASPAFNGMGMAGWCDDLAGIYPELAEKNNRSGRERFGKLHYLSLVQHRRYADISVSYERLVADFESECARLFEAVDCPAETGPLKRFVVSPERQAGSDHMHRGWKQAVIGRIDLAGSWYARGVLKLRELARK